MRTARHLILACAATASFGACAESTLSASAASDRLSNASPDWHEYGLQYQRKFAPGHVAGLGIAHTERFRLRDKQLLAAYSRPLTKQTVATLDAHVSDTHRVLARYGIAATLQHEFAPAWLIHGGAKTTRYDSATVNQGMLMLEHYVSSFSLSAAWRPSRALHTTAHGFELRGTHYYGNRDSVGLILAAGQEAASIAGGVVLTDVRSIALVGRHWINDAWGFSYSLGRTRQGDFYTRNGFSLGLQYTF